MKSRSIVDAVEGVASKWAKQRKREERAASARLNRRYVMMRQQQITMKEAAERVLPHAWAMASGDGEYPASARQIFYAARGPMQAMTGKPPVYNYFSQTLLPDYIEQKRLDWDVVYDARGNYYEPHTGTSVPLSTLHVRDYLDKVDRHLSPTDVPCIEISTSFPTVGPKHRFGAVLFIEKEGFGPLIEAAQGAACFDLAAMSTKGMSVTAARRLAETVCGGNGIPLLILHDFDVAVFTIAGTLRESTRRYQYAHDFRVIDIGFKLEDVDGLESEEVVFSAREDPGAKAATLSRYGATEEEINYLLNDSRRVELNAMTSPEFVAFGERKLAAHGIEKIVPDVAALELGAHRAATIGKMQAAIETPATHMRSRIFQRTWNRSCGKGWPPSLSARGMTCSSRSLVAALGKMMTETKNGCREAQLRYEPRGRAFGPACRWARPLRGNRRRAAGPSDCGQPSRNALVVDLRPSARLARAQARPLVRFQQ